MLLGGASDGEQELSPSIEMSTYYTVLVTSLCTNSTYIQ